MKKRNIDVVCRQGQYKGIGFIRSRKSEDKVIDMAEEMIAVAERHSICLDGILVDDSGSRDIDREKIGELYEYMERGCISVALVRSIFDITNDRDDLFQFLKKAGECGVSVYSMEHNLCPVCVPWDGGGSL